uniref:Uncharacterized protein n=1 Tax=Caenorhabditis japonica TaxID=281687 RepID=A0A8R1DP99_CAEJA
MRECLILGQPSKRVEKQDTWLVSEDDRKIHQEVCDKYLKANIYLYRTVRKADYYAHVYCSPDTDRSNLCPKIDPKVFETSSTTVSDENAWTKLKLDGNNSTRIELSEFYHEFYHRYRRRKRSAVSPRSDF